MNKKIIAAWIVAGISLLVLLSVAAPAEALNLTLISNTDRCTYLPALDKDYCNSIYEIDPVINPAVGIYSPAKAAFLFKTDKNSAFLGAVSGLQYNLSSQNKGGKIRINITALKNPYQTIDNVFCYNGDCDYSKAWWSSSWTIRRLINISNPYAINITGNLGQSGNITALSIDTRNCSVNGADIRIIYNDSISLYLINTSAYNSSNTHIYFRIMSTIPANGYDDTHYYFYCGNPVAPFYSAEIINLSINGRDFQDVSVGQYSQSKWVFTDFGATWNIQWDNAVTASCYSDNGPGKYSWIKLLGLPNESLNYVVWLYTNDGNNGVTGRMTTDGREITTGAISSPTFVWKRLGTMVMNSSSNNTFDAIQTNSFFIRAMFVTTDNNNMTPPFTPDGRVNITNQYWLNVNMGIQENFYVPPANITNNLSITFCIAPNTLYTRTVHFNKTAEAWDEQYYTCPYGCSNSTITTLGYPGCRESDLELILIVILMILLGVGLIRVVFR
jgi:hypothetical protein